MSKALESNNQQFQKNFHSVLSEPSKIHDYLKKRTKEFDQIINKEFKRLGLTDDFALLALGGYGRSELFPSSDIDLCIVQFKKVSDKLEDVKDFVAWLWTLKVKVGHSVRTIKDIEKIAKVDPKEFTSLLSSRIIFCPKKEETELKKGLLSVSGSWSKTKFFKIKKLEQAQRYKAFDSTEFNLEPDVKESPGCLRDYQSALWILEHCFGVNHSAELKDLELFSSSELKKVEHAYHYVQCVRFMLNLSEKSNRMSFENQLLLAKKLKLRSTKVSSAVEKFMHSFFLHASTLSDFNEMVFQAYEDRLSLLKRPHTKSYYLFKDRLGISNNINLANNPEAILHSLLQVGKLKKVRGLDFVSMKKIKEALLKIDPEFFLSQYAGDQFILLLKSPHNLPIILKKLKQLGILRLLIPEFGEIEGQMQFDMFHVFTVDEHTLKVVINMHRMKIGESSDSLKIEYELINKLPKIELLYLAGIFHDLGKGKGGDHSNIGETIARKFSRRLGFSAHDAELLGWLVKNHLVMSSMSQKTDVHDPETITAFTKNVDSAEKLNYIYLLTINDIQGTNPSLWNSWKHDLLKDLFLASRRKLNLEEPRLNQSVIAERKDQSIAALSQKQLNIVSPIWSKLPQSYFVKNSLTQLSNHSKAIAKKEAVSLTKRGNLIEVFIFLPNQPGLFFRTVSAFELLSLEIIDANIQTTSDDQYALNTFICRHKVLGSNLTQRDHANIKQKIVAQISSESLEKRRAINAQNIKHPFKYQTRVNISYVQSQEAYLITLETLDQPSLLSKIADVLVKNELSIFSARITTLGEKVEDNFLIKSEEIHAKISASQQKIITNQLQAI